MTIGKTDNGLTLMTSDDNRMIVLCWDGDTDRMAGSGDPITEVKTFSDAELREMMVSAEQWQADQENLRNTRLYQRVSSYMQHIKHQLKARTLTA